MNVERKRIAIDSLHLYEANPRTISKDAFANLKRSMQEDPDFMDARPLIVNTHAGRENVIVGGNMRFRAAKELGWADVPAVLVDLPPDMERQWNLKDNNQWGEYDEQQLAEMLYKMREEGAEVETLGFSEKELSRLLDTVSGTHVGGDEDEDDATPPAEPETEVGDLIVLGRHRLLCGDALDTTSYAILLGEEKVTMAFTDPPWNVDIGGDNNPRHRQRPGLQNDDLPEVDFAKFLNATADTLIRIVTGDLYLVMGCENWPTVDAALRRAGFHWSGTIVWAKDIFVLGRSNYHRQYEPVWYGWPKKGRSSFGGARDISDLWQIARPRRSEEHPSMKPIELVERSIKNSSQRGDLILDCFGGSGTTLLAAERSERVCRMVEISPGYCDVVVNRWEKQTGQKAIRPARGTVTSDVGPEGGGSTAKTAKTAKSEREN